MGTGYVEERDEGREGGGKGINEWEGFKVHLLEGLSRYTCGHGQQLLRSLTIRQQFLVSCSEFSQCSLPVPSQMAEIKPSERR